MARRTLVDAHNVLDPGAWRETGWDYRHRKRS